MNCIYCKVFFDANEKYLSNNGKVCRKCNKSFNEKSRMSMSSTYKNIVEGQLIKDSKI